MPSKILIVDDFEAFRRFVGSLLQQRGPFEIEEACDGLEAVRKAEQFAPDLILLDIGLPKLNGLEVAARVNNLVPAAKILFFSVEFSAEVVQDALNLGALGFVDKSRAHSDLVPAIARVLSGKRFVSNGLAVGEGAEAQDSHTHEVLFCSNDEVLLDGLTHFIAAALNVGNAAIVWASESHRNALVDRLQALRVDIAGAMQRGIYMASDVEEPANPWQMLETIRSLREAACKAGKKQPRVAMCGERAGCLWAGGKTDEAIRIEQIVNKLGQSHDLDILCVYPLPFGGEREKALKSICAEHTAVQSR